MTQDEIIEMARLAGMELDDSFVLEKEQIWYFCKENFIAFAKLVAAKEREACANTCYELMLKENPYEQWNGMKLCMESIRARSGDTK